MRKFLLSSLFLCLFGGQWLNAQELPEAKVLEDVTSKVQNADFSQGEPVAVKISTYDYDMKDAGVGAGGVCLFGQQPVTGWTAAFPSDNIKQMENSGSPARTDVANAKASGIFAYPDAIVEDETPGLGGSFYAPLADADYQGQCLGMVSVWGAAVQYTQNVTLPAGDYMMVVTLQNTAGGSEMLNSFMGFVPAEGTATYSSKTKFEAGEWATDTIFFRLKAETAGALSLGYKSGNYGSGGAYHLFIDNVKLYTIEQDVINQIEINAAKEVLQELINIGEDRDADTSAAQAVYDNPNATLEEVLAAIEAQKALNEQAITDLSAFFIKNAHFSLDDPIEDGITTYDYDMPDPAGANGKKVTHYGMQPVTGWTASTPSDNIQHMQSSSDPANSLNGRASGVFAIGSDAFLGGGAFLPPTEMSDGSTEGKLLSFLSVWSAMSQYTQRVSLPAGRYTLTFSYYNVGGGGTINKNLMGFVADDGTEYLGTTTTFTANKWLQESIKFELDEPTAGVFTMGYTASNAGSGSMPHLFVDGVSLNYVGTGINASLFALSAAIATGEEALEKEFYGELKDQLQDAVDNAQKLLDDVSDDDETNKAAANAISELISDVNENIVAYEKLNRFYDNDLMVAYEKYDAENYAALNEKLSAMKDEVEGAKEDYTWSTAQIEEYIAAFTPMLKAEVKTLFDAAVASGEKLAADLDISILFDQMAYTYSENAVSGSNVPDKEWKYGNAGNFKTQYGTAEVWNQSPFTVSRTLTDMPAGTYTLTTKAFYRTAANTDNYLNYDESDERAFVFAGNVKTALTNVVALANRDAEGQDGWVAVEEGGSEYVPNTQKAAYEVFTDAQYTDLLQKSATTAITETGDLTFGITADQMDGNCWTVWYTFSIAYNAVSADVLNNEIQALIDKALVYLQDENLMVLEASNQLNNSISAGEAAIDNESVEAKAAAIKSLKDAIQYVLDGQALVEKLTAKVDFYNELLMSYPEIISSDNTLNTMLESTEEGFATNEAVQEFIDTLPKAWVGYVMGQDLSTASELSPVDVSPVIINPTFDNDNADNWTIMRVGGSTPSGQFGVFEFFNPDTCRISQSIPALPEGYYLVRVQSFYRAGNNEINAKSMTESADTVYRAYLFAETDKGYMQKAIKNVVNREDEQGVLSPDAYEVSGEVKVAYGEYEEFYVPNNRESFVTYAENGCYWNEVAIRVDAGETLTVGLYKNQHMESDWLPFDNFQLLYMGTTAPVGVESIEASAKQGVAAIYNLAGQRVAKAVKGLYIVNGKKIVVK